MKKLFKAYVADWRIPTSIYLGLFLLWFSEDCVAIGPGWDMYWLLAWFLHWFVFLVISLCRRDGRRRYFLLAFLLCNLFQFGGCYYVYNCLLPILPQDKECVFATYDRFALGRHSAYVPVGSWNIKFKYYNGLFSGRTVECQVSEDDFLWFCWRNRYKVRRGLKLFNERTGEFTNVPYFGYEPKEGVEDSYYSYIDVAASCAGIRIIYDIKKQAFHLWWSTN